jgi:hypothetical protein
VGDIRQEPLKVPSGVSTLVLVFNPDVAGGSASHRGEYRSFGVAPVLAEPGGFLRHDAYKVLILDIFLMYFPIYIPFRGDNLSALGSSRAGRIGAPRT